MRQERMGGDADGTAEAFGLLVPLGFGVPAFTPAAYRRHRL